MQGAEDEVEGSVLTYVIETEFRKQRSRSPSCNSLFYISSEDDQPLLHLRDGDKGEDERVRISVVALGEGT